MLTAKFVDQLVVVPMGQIVIFLNAGDFAKTATFFCQCLRNIAQPDMTYQANIEQTGMSSVTLLLRS